MAAVFTPISREEMEDFLGIPNPGHDDKVYPEGYKGFKPVRFPGTYEIVYSKRVDPESGNQLALRIYSGINLGSGESRDVGEDAIRVQLFARDYEGQVTHVGGSRRCHRVKGWRANLQKRLDAWEEQLGPSCPKCGRMMAEREGKKGKFWGCPGYRKDNPESCDGTLPYSAKGAPDCPVCEGAMAKRSSAKGEFFGCCNYPDCRGTRDMECRDTTFRPQAGKVQAGKVQASKAPAEVVPECPKCQARMVRRRGPKGEFFGCSNYPDCRGTRELDGTDTTFRPQAAKAPVQAAKAPVIARPQAARPQERPAPVAKAPPRCPQCSKGHLVLRSDRQGEFWGCSAFPSCRFTAEVT